MVKHKELKELYDWLISELQQDGELYDIDSDDLSSKMKELGLLVEVKIPEEVREEYPACANYDTDTLDFSWDSPEARGIFDGINNESEGSDE